MGKPGCCFGEPCGGPHITCRLDWSSYQNVLLHSLTGYLQIALFVIGAAGMHLQSPFYFFSFTDTFSRIRKKCFVERGWHDYSSWPYDDLQGCSARRYQWFHFKVDGAWLGVGPDAPTAESQAWVWRATCASLKFSMYLVHFRGDRRVLEVYGGNDTWTSSGGREDGATWLV